MFKLWSPSDNKFATELEVKREAALTNIRAMESKMVTLRDRVDMLEKKVFVFETNLAYLRSDQAKVIKIDEFKAVDKALQFSRHEHICASNELCDLEKALKVEKANVEVLTGQIEKVRFRLLEFRKREEN